MHDNTTNVHPDLKKFVKTTPGISVTKRNLWIFSLLMALTPSPKPPEDVLIKNISIQGRDAQQRIRLRVYQPKTTIDPAPALLWMHGGGYVMGKPEIDDTRCADFVQALGIVVVSVDYRYAPKFPFPAGLEDSHTALKWLKTHAKELGVDEERIAIGGESAGGGMAAALAQLAHDRQEVTPIFQLLIYPMLDDRTVMRAEVDDSQNITWSQKSNRFGWESYLGRGISLADVPAYAVPARREDLSGLPPAWIGVGTLDIFHDEDVSFAQRLRSSGVECQLEVVPGAFHAFDILDKRLPVVSNFQRQQVEILKHYLF